MKHEYEISRREIRVRILCTILFLSTVGLNAHAGFRLASVFGDNMVLQRDQPLQVWGEAKRNSKVKLSFNGQVINTRANKNGEWAISLKPIPHGGPYSMTITCSDTTIFIENILVGDVWFCSGQSNMVWTVSKSNNAEEEIAAANYPGIRHFNVERKIAFEPGTDVQGKWEVCHPETAGDFSAVAYYFARGVYRETNIPIGLVNASWGGTEIEPWISKESFTLLPAEVKDHYSYTPETFPDSVKARYQRGEDSLTKIPPNLYPSVLYNGMVSPFTRFPVKGVLWYQGENNAHAERSSDYYTLFPCLIQDWRARWGYEFPFYWVQLANYKPESQVPVESYWAELRDAQHQALSLPGTGEAVTIDIGEAHDIHPKNKQDVGKRLAIIALNKVHDRDTVYSGPVLNSMTIKGNKVILDFNHVGSGLTAKNKYGYLQGFSLAGADGQFAWAKAYINNKNQVVVYSEKIPHPVSVRYAWSDNPGDANLYNKEGLPASPFQRIKN